MTGLGLDGDSRFEFRRSLGEGGYGIVFEAWDRTRARAVAVKRLRKTDAVALLRFKQEFRAVADVRHRNLVRLEEMFSRDGEWFVTMELVDGVDLLDWVRPADRAVQGYKRAFDEARLRGAFAELCDGLAALHAAGILHRDLKPSNVMVTQDGRVVILDFGLVAYLGTSEGVSASNLVGTPAYMSPENVTGARLTEASDWYCVGLMLFEALTGRLPFEGSFHELLQARVQHDPPSARDVDATVPRELEALCRDLLSREPAARPAGAEISRRLRRTPGDSGETATSHSGAASPFVGRAPHLADLRDAFEHARSTAPAIVHLTGASGMGKTTLARRFLKSLGDDALVLAGRCYQRESVPYKAVDSVIDGISRHLRERSAAETARIVPRDLGALARMFPVLREFDPDGRGGRPAGAFPDAQELRRRGFGALRELLVTLARERTLVLFVDDLQWGDLDSGQLLLEVLRPPDPPRLLLIACYRHEEAADSPLLQLLDAHTPAELRRWDVQVNELEPDEARALALLHLGGTGVEMETLAEALAVEARGNPFLVDQLAHFRRAMRGASSQTLRLESVVDFRLAQLPADARRLIEVIAVVGRPLDLRPANQAAGLDPHAVDAVEALRGGRWIRTRVRGTSELAEVYHDRLRETIVALLPSAQLPAIHTRVALALQAGGEADAEALSEHFQQAGERVIAARHALRAAKTAGEQLAFDRAVRLYRVALELGEYTVAEQRVIRTQLGEALTNAGRGEEAAREFLGAAEGAAADESLELRRRAAERFLMSGLIDEGVAESARVLAMIGLGFSATPRRALLRLVLRRAQLRLRGVRFTPRAASEIGPELLRRMDVTWSVGAGLSMADPIQANYFQVTNLLDALRSGEPFRITRALVMELAVSSMGGSRSQRHTDVLCTRCTELVRQVEHPYTDAFFALVESLVANLGGRFAEAVDAADRGEAMFRERCTGVAWETETAQLYGLHSLVNLGRWKALEGRALPLLSEAEGRGDVYLATYVRTRNLFLFFLAADELEKARDAQERSLEGWTRHGFQLQHYWNWYARCEIDLYAGRPRAAWDRLKAQWRTYSRSMLPRTQALHVEICFLRVRTAVALAVSGDGDTAALLAHAERDVQRLERERIPWAAAQAALGRALVAHARGAGESTVPMFSAAAELLDRAQLEHFAAAARAREASLRGTTAIDGDAWMAREGVRDPERMLQMLAPGRWT